MTNLAPLSATLNSTPGPQEQAQVLAALCKAGADTLRLRILRLLRHDAMDVSELCEVLDVRQPALSHHLKLMSNSGLLSSQRDGNHIFYRRRTVASDDPRMGLQQALFAAADELPLDDPMQLRLGALQKHREHNSISFFHENAARFRQQQDLIAGPERYATAVAAALTSAATQRRQLALEIGPGEGWLLPRLSALFDKVVALDNAAAMLEASRSSAARAQLENVEFVLGDTSIAALDNLNADLVVINMVLHHTPDPALTLAQAANCLSPGGVLLVTELCAHEQGWARESCGDLWLGFEPQLIEDWARAAGLEEFSSDYLAQRNGFTLQVRLFSAAHSALS